MSLKFNLILAKTEQNGIGYKGGLPWKLKKELGYFQKMTKDVKDSNKQNAVVMGRKTWDSMEDGFRPLAKRLNIVLSSKAMDLKGAMHCFSLEEVQEKLTQPEYKNSIETTWVIGGSRVYEDCIKKDLVHRIYLTQILKDYPCDTFVNIDVSDGYLEVTDSRVPTEVQREGDTEYLFKVYERNISTS